MAALDRMFLDPTAEDINRINQEINNPGKGKRVGSTQSGRIKRKSTEMNAPNTATVTNNHGSGASPSAGGNLAHASANDTRFQDLIAKSAELGATFGKGQDVAQQHLLTVFQAAFDGVIDNTRDKHGPGIDDAFLVAKAYWDARNKSVVFNAKAPNQRKSASCVRQVIALGGWHQGGPSEPLNMVNSAMRQYLELRKVPGNMPKLRDGYNYVVEIARKMKKAAQVLDLAQLRTLAFKPDRDVLTPEEVLATCRNTIQKLFNGKHSAGKYSTPNVEAALKALNKEFKAIADSRGEKEPAEKNANDKTKGTKKAAAKDAKDDDGGAKDQKAAPDKVASPPVVPASQPAPPAVA